MTVHTRQPPPMRQGSADDFQTPASALGPLLPHLPRQGVIWEPACGQGQLVRGLEAVGFRALGTDILTGSDFLHTDPPEGTAAIVTNPPYSIKDAWLARCYALGIPFALLLPLTTFEGRKRQALFRTHGVEVVFMPGRVAFTTPSGKEGGSWFMCAWFTWGLGLGRSLTFWDPRCQMALCEEDD